MTFDMNICLDGCYCINNKISDELKIDTDAKERKKGEREKERGKKGKREREKESKKDI